MSRRTLSSDSAATPSGRPVRRWIWRSVAALVALVALLVAAAAVVAMTAPSPRASDTWSQLAQLATARGEAAGAVLTTQDGQVFAAIGGLEGVVTTAADTVELYDPEADRWRTGPPLPEPRHHLAAAGINGTLFAAGGASSASDWSPQPEVWRLDRDASGWESIAPLPEGRLGHRLLVVDDVLYLVGGDGGAAVLRLDPFAGDDEWSERADLPHPRDHLGAVVIDGEIWAIGGRVGTENVARVDIYDPDRDRWRSGPPLPEPTSAAAVGVVDGWIVVSGGEDPRLSGGIIDRHWRLRPGGGSWEPAPKAPLAVHGAADGVVNGRLLIAGGASRQGLLSPLAWTALTQSLADPAR